MNESEDVEMLRLEMDTLWGLDQYGRSGRSHPLVAIAVAEEGRVVRFGTDALARSIDLAPSDRASSLGGESPPSEIEIYRERFASTGLGMTRVSGGPSYVVPEGSLLTPPTPSQLEILVVDGSTASRLTPLRPQEWWAPQEWADLVAGHLGPCAIGLVAGRVQAICHTPVASGRAAEAGAWTHPDARRRGYGAAVTAAWARTAAPRFDTLFYSTTAENVGSQGIARTLGLRPIGWIWQLRREE